MKKTFPIIVLGLLFFTCKSDDYFTNNTFESKISFDIEKLNSQNNFISKVQSFKLNKKSSGWKKKRSGRYANYF